MASVKRSDNKAKARGRAEFLRRNPKRPRPVRKWVPWIAGECRSSLCPGLVIIGTYRRRRLLYVNRRTRFIPTGRVFALGEKGLCTSCAARHRRHSVAPKGRLHPYPARMMAAIDEEIMAVNDDGSLNRLPVWLFKQAVKWFAEHGVSCDEDRDWIAVLDRYAPDGRSATRELKNAEKVVMIASYRARNSHAARTEKRRATA